MSFIVFLFIKTYHLQFTMDSSAQPQISRGGVGAKSSTFTARNTGTAQRPYLWLSWGMDQVNIRREKRQAC